MAFGVTGSIRNAINLVKQVFLFFPQKKPCFDVFDCSFVIRFELNILSKKMTSEAFSEGHLTPDVSFISVLRVGCLITC